MKKLIVFSVFLMLLALWGFGVILPDAGYLLIILGQKTLETSLWFVCFVLLSFFIIVWIITRFVHFSWSLAQGLSHFFVFARSQRSNKRAAGSLAAIGQLQQASTLAANETPPERIVLLRKTWAKIPRYQQKMPQVIAAYAYALITHFCDQEAEVILRKAIERTWDNSLVDLYGVLRTKDTTQLIKCAEDWLKHQTHNPVLLRALGRLSLRNQVWGLARDYFQKSLAAEKNAETYAELARLLNHLGETQKSLETYQEALQLSIPSLPELPQPVKKH